jgi:two-component system KDP operon response regulator KdpE
MSKVLLVDDEPQILRFLGPTLRAAGYEVALAETGADAMATLKREAFAAIVLDLGLPDVDGKLLIDRIRALGPAPIIVLSARDSEAEKIEALDRGANDYVVKPFAVGELLARLRVLLRTSERAAPGPVVRVRGGHIDLSRRRAVLDGLELRLTRRETDFLGALAAANGEVVSNRELLAQIWGASSVADAQFVRALASQVRQKIELDSKTSRIVVTEPGLGYRLEIDPAQGADEARGG